MEKGQNRHTTSILAAEQSANSGKKESVYKIFSKLDNVFAQISLVTILDQYVIELRAKILHRSLL